MAANEPLHDDVFSAPHGIPGLDTLFTITYSEGVNKGRITLPHLVKMTSEKPAKIFGLYPKKGTLAVGADADEGDVTEVDVTGHAEKEVERLPEGAVEGEHRHQLPEIWLEPAEEEKEEVG